MFIVCYSLIFDVILEDVQSSSLSCTRKAKDFHEGEVWEDAIFDRSLGALLVKLFCFKHIQQA